MENLRPRLETSYEEALELEIATNAEIERQQAAQAILKEESERLKKLKSEHSSVEFKNNQAYESGTLSNTANLYSAQQDGYKLPVPPTVSSINSLPQLNYIEKDTNSTLKAMQERIGISRCDHDESHISKATLETASSVKYFSESGEVLRPVHVPQCLISKFLHLAARNTDNNLETCGVLAGKLNHDEFTITCLIIPKQVATSDTCAMINEEEIITAQDSLDVMSLGWIHVYLHI